MHVTMIGAGALGRVYGVRLASAGVDVAFFVRPRRLGEREPFIIEQQNATRRRDVLASPVRVAQVPVDTDVVLVTVRFDQLLADGGAALAAELSRTEAPIVVLTPLLPDADAALREALGRPVVHAMPGVAGHVDEHGLVRYWTSALQPTRLDANAPDARSRDTIERLARRLDAAELPTVLEDDVARKNAATTVAFFPFIAAIAPGRGIEGVLADDALLTTTLAALRETSALAPKLGPQQPFARWIARFASPGSLAAVVAVARMMAPDLLHFLDAHFGPKLHDQHVAMGASVLALAREHDVAMPALEQLMERVREVSTP